MPKIKQKIKAGEISITLKLNKDEAFLQNEINVINNPLLKEFADIAVQGAGKASFTTACYSSVEAVLRTGVYKAQFFGMVLKMLDVLHLINENSLNINNIMLEPGSIAVMHSGDLVFTYLPVNKSVYSNNIFGFFYDIISKTKPLDNDVMFASRFQGFLAQNREFVFERILEFIDVECPGLIESMPLRITGGASNAAAAAQASGEEDTVLLSDAGSESFNPAESAPVQAAVPRTETASEQSEPVAPVIGGGFIPEQLPSSGELSGETDNGIETADEKVSEPVYAEPVAAPVDPIPEDDVQDDITMALDDELFGSEVDRIDNTFAQPAEPIIPSAPIPVAQPAEPIIPSAPIPVAQPAATIAPPAPIPVAQPAEPITPPAPIPVAQPAEPIAPPAPIPVAQPAATVAQAPVPQSYINSGETTVLTPNGMDETNSGNTVLLTQPQRIRKLLLTFPGQNKNVVVEGGEFKIGSDAAYCNFAIQNTSISRVHIFITFDGTDYYVNDKGSTNGTMLNGAPLQKGVPVKLKNYDRLILANEIMNVQILED